MNRRIINARFSIIGRALYYLGVYSFRRKPSADTHTQYTWDVYARLWHPLLWVYALIYAVYQSLENAISTTITLIRRHGRIGTLSFPKEQDTPNQTTQQQ